VLEGRGASRSGKVVLGTNYFSSSCFYQNSTIIFFFLCGIYVFFVPVPGIGFPWWWDPILAGQEKKKVNRQESSVQNILMVGGLGKDGWWPHQATNVLY
jgi:hypothetical protein